MINLSINLDELAFVLHRSPEFELQCYLNLDNGEIMNIPTNKEALTGILELKNDPQLLSTEGLVKMIIPKDKNYLSVPDLFSQIIYDIMGGFADTIKDKDAILYDELWHNIHHGGGYSGFHRIIKSRQNYQRKFIAYRDSAYEKNAIKWLKENDINPIPGNSTYEPG